MPQPHPDSEIASAKLAQKHDILQVVDATTATAYLFHPIEFVADIEIHSATKFLGGHGSTLGGILVGAGNCH